MYTSQGWYADEKIEAAPIGARLVGGLPGVTVRQGGRCSHQSRGSAAGGGCGGKTTGDVISLQGSLLTSVSLVPAAINARLGIEIELRWELCVQTLWRASKKSFYEG